MLDIHYLKTNLVFLAVFFIFLSILLFFLFRLKYPNETNRNIFLAIIITLIIVIFIYNVPIKLPKMRDNFDDKLITTSNIF